MGPTLKKVLFAVAFVIGAFVVLVSMQPGQFRVARSATIQAPPEAVFPLVNDFHKWAVWSPWEKLDPSMKKTFSGAESGVGAVYAWSGNSDVGEGRMTIGESQPNERLEIRLEFLKPFESTSISTFRFRPEGAGDRGSLGNER
jgi:uncharacterized protein YndB with AHSA1/START domain